MEKEKYFIVFIFIFCLVMDTFAQIPPPGISWKRSDRLSEYPSNTTPEPDQLIDNVSEDWWYDHKNSYINGEIAPENFDGFITCGYSSIRNIQLAEVNGGCHSVSYACNINCTDELDFYPFEEQNFESFQTMARYDIHGKLKWFKTFNNAWFMHVIQTHDGNYVAVGPTLSTRENDRITPLAYNPNASNGWTNSFGINGISCSTTRKINVVKVDPNGNIIWNYIYGLKDITDSDCPDEKLIPMDLVEYDIANDPKIRIVGSVDLINSGVPATYSSLCMIDIDADDGAFNWGTSIDPERVKNPGLCPTPLMQKKIGYAIEKDMTANGEVLAVVGTDDDALNVDCLNPGERDLNILYFDISSTTPLWEEFYYFTGAAGNINFGVWDLCFDANHDLLVPVAYSCNQCIWAGDNFAEAAVIRVDHTNAGIIGQYQISDNNSDPELVHAFDLKIGITNTADGGFAIVSSKVNEMYSVKYGSLEWECPHDNDPQTLPNQHCADYWNSDAFVRKYYSNGTVEWSKQWDIDDASPVAFPGDLKKQECLYSITETPDLGLVVAGNNSRNFDDCYLVKLFDNCNNTAEVDVINDPTSGIIEIQNIGTGNGIINSSLRIRGSVVIHNGETLIITGSGTIVEFADSRKCGFPCNIIVEPGGYLLIENEAKLTSLVSCDPYSMWDGIQLWGDNQSVQDPSTQPYVELNLEATIENARYGICADKLNHYIQETWLNPNECFLRDMSLYETQANGGGYVDCIDGNFRNCRFSVVLDAYVGQENNSIFLENDFVLDEYIHDFDAIDDSGNRLGINAFIKFFAVERTPGIIINANNFIIDQSVMSPQADLRGTGIGSFDSNIQITNNNFYNLYYGIKAGSSNTFNTLSAKCNNFDYVVRGASISNIDFFKVNGNSFIIAGEDHPFGLYLENCTGYEIQDNNFYSNAADWSVNPAGLVNYYSVPNSNVNSIEYNRFYDLKYSALLEGEHMSQSDNDLGLELIMNEFYDYDYAIAVTLDPGIAGLQGPSSGANNILDGCNANEGELYNPSPSNPFIYYHKQNASGLIVVPTSGCFTPSGQVIPSQILTQIDPLDYIHSAADCGYSMRTNQILNVKTDKFRISSGNLSQQEMQLKMNESIRHYLHDSVSNYLDSIKIELFNASIIVPNYLKMQLNEKYKQAGFISSVFNINHLDNSTPFYGISLMKDTLSWSSIVRYNYLRDDLINLSNDSNSIGCSSAQNILEFVYDVPRKEFIKYPFTSASHFRKSEVNNSLKIYPNPFNNEFAVELSDFKKLTQLIYLTLLVT